MNAPFKRGTSALAVLTFLWFGGWRALAAEPTNASPSHLLLLNRFGKPVHVSTNDVPASLHPPASTGLGQQVPSPAKGASMSDEVRERIAQSKTGREWFPTTPPVLMPYLAGVDDFGNTAIQGGALIPLEPRSMLAQRAKYGRASPW